MKESERRARLRALLDRNELKRKLAGTSLLFDECIVSLGNDVVILSDEKSKEVYGSFEREFKITSYGRIDWNQCDEYEEISVNTFKSRFANQAESGYLLWSHGSDPVIMAGLSQVAGSLDEIMAVSPDVWIYQVNRQVIEIFHDGTIRVMKKKQDTPTL